MNVRRILLPTIAGLVALGVLTQSASALPAFARKYQTSCVTCHASFPRLNAVGEAFRLDGFKLVDDEIYIKEQPMDLGDDAYKKVWPNAVWPSDLPSMPPISLVITSEFDIDIGGTKKARSEFVFPRNVKLLGAGRFGDNMSFFLELGFEQGGGGHGGHGGEEDDGLETEIEGWLQFEDLLLAENKLNLRVGTVGMQELGLFTARDHNRLTLNPYLYSSWSSPVPNAHELEESLGEEIEIGANPFVLHAQPGVEVNGFGRSWRYALGIVNGNGSVSDDNSEKDLYTQFAYKIGGRGFDGSTQDESGALGGAEPWRDDSVTLSLFGYYGTATVEVDEVFRDDRFWRFGPGIRWSHKDFALGAGYIFGENDRPFGALSSESVDSQSWFVEAEYFVYPWLVTSARYEVLDVDTVDIDLGLPELFTTESQDRERIILSAKALLRANVSMIVEGRFHLDDDRFTDDNDGDQIAFGLSVAF